MAVQTLYSIVFSYTTLRTLCADQSSFLSGYNGHKQTPARFSGVSSHCTRAIAVCSPCASNSSDSAPERLQLKVHIPNEKQQSPASGPLYTSPLLLLLARNMHVNRQYSRCLTTASAVYLFSDLLSRQPQRKG